MAFSKPLVLKLIRTRLRLLSAISKRRAAKLAFRLFCTPQHRNLKEPAKIFAEAESLQFDFQHYQIHGYRWQKGAGRKVLILHGFESSAINFDKYVRPLIKKGYEVLAFDAPAHGRSTGKQINVRLYKQFIIHLFEKFGPIQSFMGHSLGGQAISLALEDLPHDEDTRVALIAPATETTTAIESFFHFLKLSDGIKNEFEKLIFKIGGQPSAWYSVSRAVPKLKAKILWAHDRNDTMTPIKDVEPVMKQNYPNVQFRITEGLGHRRIYRDSTVSKEVIAFL
jgi:pimeloyl-ACP methyl ester carboxylesterase